MKSYNEKKLANFDSLLINTPNENEKIIKKLLPLAKSLQNKSVYLEMLARLALTQTIQKKFKLAQKTLDNAASEMNSKHIFIKVRLLIEQGRLFLLSHNNKAALPILKKAYYLSKKYGYEDLMIDAIHFMPVIVKTISEKIKWNKRAISIAKKSRNKKMAGDWLAVLYQTIGLNYIDAKQYKKALASFLQAKKLAIKYSPKIVILGAEIGIAKSLRLLNRVDNALSIQINLLKTWKELSKKTADSTQLKIFHGWICEELTEIFILKAKYFSVLAYKSLAQDNWHKQYAKKRLGKLKNLTNSFKNK